MACCVRWGSALLRFAEPAAEFWFVSRARPEIVFVCFIFDNAWPWLLGFDVSVEVRPFCFSCVRERERELSLDLRHQVVCRSTVKASEFCMPAKGSRAHGGFPGASGPVRARAKTLKKEYLNEIYFFVVEFFEDCFEEASSSRTASRRLFRGSWLLRRGCFEDADAKTPTAGATPARAQAGFGVPGRVRRGWQAQQETPSSTVTSV